MFYTDGRMHKRKTRMAVLPPALAGLFLLMAGALFAQTGSDDAAFWGSIPEELLRPRRNEAPRYPVDTVIGPLGPGRASRETYEFARRVAAALLAGNMDAPILASVNRMFLEGYMAALNVVNPRAFRLGGGQESPDGSVSFLVRFVGREHGVTGELFVRFVERQVPVPQAPPAAPPDDTEGETDPAYPAEGLIEEQAPQPAPPVQTRTERTWIFDDLVLESPRSREEENQENRQRFGFSTYHRLF